MKQALSLILFALLFIGAYEENIRQDIFLVRPDNEYINTEGQPTYLTDEDLTFFACIEADNTPLRLSLLCEDTNEFADLNAYRWGPDNCFIGSVNLEQFECTQAIVRAEYIEGEESRQLERRVQINTFSDTLNRIVETQFTDGGWQGALDTAYGLFVLNHYPDLFSDRITNAIEYLKLNRDEEDKCWPQEDCQISTTANILFLLEKAGIEETRIQHDATIYIEREQNYIEGSVKWNATIQDLQINLNNTINTSCVYDYNEQAVETFSIPRHPETTTRTFNPVYGQTVNIVCTEPVQVLLTDEYGGEMFQYIGDNFTYEVPQPCWTLNNERISCDIRTTLFAANTEIDANQKNAARNYLQTLLVDDRTAGRHVELNWTLINDALYAHAEFTDTDEILRGLLFQQNNTGNWDKENTYYPFATFEATQEEQLEIPERLNDTITRTIMNTGYVVMSLLENGFERDDEPIRDAQRFISLVEDQTSQNITEEQLTDEEFVEEYESNKTSILNDPKRNAMAWYVLQNNARPLIRTEPSIVILNTPNTTVDLINPTIFDLDEIQYELSPSLQGKIRIEEKDFIGAYSFRRVRIDVLDNAETTFGYLRLTINDNEYLKLPIIIDEQPELSITLPEQLTVFGSSTTLPFNIQKSSHDFSCALEWESTGISSSQTFNINNLENNNSYNYPVRFSVLETANEIYNFTITCESQGVTFITPLATNIQRFASRPIQVLPSSISIEQANTPQTIQVTNLLDQEIEVTAQLRETEPNIILSETFLLLLPGERTNITVEIAPPEGENYSTTNSIIFTSFNIEERVLLNAEIIPVEEDYTILIITLVTTAGILTLLGVFTYQKREKIKAWYNEHFNKEDQQEKLERELREIELAEQGEAIRNLMKIAKLQGKKDSEIQQLLKEAGYTEQDVAEALKKA